MKRYDNNLDGTLDEHMDGRYVEYDDHLAARKWAKAWKMQATGERIQKEQAAKAYCDEANKVELSQLSNQTLRAELMSCHAQIERLKKWNTQWKQAAKWWRADSIDFAECEGFGEPNRAFSVKFYRHK